MSRFRVCLAAAATVCGIAVTLAQGTPDRVSERHPAIRYRDTVTTDAVAQLNARIVDGSATLTHSQPQGYLRAVLDALKVPVESQMLVFSETSLQSEFITRDKPRALYFNDHVAVGWVQGADALEVAALDPQQGMVWYVLDQTPSQKPHFSRSQRCLECHESPASTLNVSGMLTMSMLPMSDDPNEYAQGWAVDHRTPYEDRWGGWFVTGSAVPVRHLGNVPVYHAKKGGTRLPAAPKLATVKGQFDTTPYLTEHSDVAALAVFNHQTVMTSLITRLNWLVRVEDHDKAHPPAPVAPQPLLPARSAPPPVQEDEFPRLVNDLVDYMLFIDEAPIPSRMQGASGFAELFAAQGPKDSRGRSLRELSLEKRTFRYPCSYMIYSDAFNALPARAKAAVYERLWAVLSGRATEQGYERLTAADRQAIIEILRDTKPDLPPSFMAAGR